MLPCTHCTRPSSCFWREAVWTPRNCKYIRMKQSQSKSCMSNKKVVPYVMFIPSSINNCVDTVDW